MFLITGKKRGKTRFLTSSVSPTAIKKPQLLDFWPSSGKLKTRWL